MWYKTAAVIAAVVVVFLLGFSYRGDAPAKVSIPFSSNLVNQGQTEFACDSVAGAFLSKDLSSDAVEVGSGAGTDRLALKFDSSKKTVTFLTRAAVEAGIAEGDKFQIIDENDTSVVAIGGSGTAGSNSILIFDKKTNQAVWSKASNALIMLGEVMYLNCR